MDSVEKAYALLSSLDVMQMTLLIGSVVIYFGGGYWVKRRNLKRRDIEDDGVVEDRGSWLFFPREYNFYEKLQSAIIFFVAFILLVLLVNS